VLIFQENIYTILTVARALSFSEVAGLWVFVDTGIGVGEFSSSSMLYARAHAVQGPHWSFLPQYDWFPCLQGDMSKLHRLLD
jgi:hypothetical protein